MKTHLLLKLVNESGDVRWGADNEDSKTPIMRNFYTPAKICGCFDESLSFYDEEGKQYPKDSQLGAHQADRTSTPRVQPHLQREPLPLHLYDFAMHLTTTGKSKSTMFYVPKLENEEEVSCT